MPPGPLIHSFLVLENVSVRIMRSVSQSIDKLAGHFRRPQKQPKVMGKIHQLPSVLLFPNYTIAYRYILGNCACIPKNHNRLRLIPVQETQQVLSKALGILFAEAVSPNLTDIGVITLVHETNSLRTLPRKVWDRGGDRLPRVDQIVFALNEQSFFPDNRLQCHFTLLQQDL